MEQEQFCGSNVSKTYARADGVESNPGYLTGIAMFDVGENVNLKMKILSGNISPSVDTENTQIQDIKYSVTIEEGYKIPENKVSASDSYLPIYMWCKDGTIYWWSESNMVMLNPNSSNMFKNLKGLTELDLTQFYTGRAINMSSMFSNCTNLNKIWVGNDWKTNRVVESTDMFSNCENIVGVAGTVYNSSYTDITYANVDRIENPGYLSAHATFKDGTSINKEMKKLFGTSNPTADTENKTIKSFEYSEEIDEENKVDVSYINSILPVYIWADTSNGKIYWHSDDKRPYLNRDASHMFSNLKGLESVDSNRLDTSKSVSMTHLFFNCTAIENIDVTGFNTRKARSLNQLFYGCNNLKSIDVRNFETGYCTNMKSMFYECTKLITLDISNFDTRKVTDTSYMFYGCPYLETVFVGELWDKSSVTTSGDMFSGCYSIVGGAGTIYNSSIVNATYAIIDGTGGNPGYLTGVAVFDTGENVNAKIKTLATGVQSTTDTVNSTIHEFKYSNTIDESLKIDLHKISAESSNLPIYAWYENGTMYWWCENYKVMLNPDSSCMFKNLSGLTNLDMSDYYALYVTNMDEMFSGCTSLSEVWISHGWKIDNVISSTNMFYNCTSIRGIGGTTYDGSHVDKLYARPDDAPYTLGYFSANAALSSGEQVNIAMKKLFNPAVEKYEADIRTIKTIEYSNMVDDSNKVDVSGYGSMLPVYIWSDTTNGKIYWYSANSRPYLNYNCSNMFSNFRGMKSVDLTAFNTSKVRNMSYMFNYCWDLQTVNISNFDTRRVTTMGHMFDYCNSLQSLDVSSFDTSNVTNMAYMFNYCLKIQSLDLSNFNTSKVTNMKDMFYRCEMLEDLCIKNFDTSQVTTMESMFQKDGKLINLDLSGFSIKKSATTKYIFSECSSLETIYVSNICDFSKASEPYAMFNGCTKIVGGAGTKFTSSKIDNSYAVVDKEGVPGYFTGNVKFDTGEAVNIKMKTLALGGNPTVDTVDTSIQEIKYSNTIDESLKVDPHKVSAEDSYSPIYMWYENGTIYWWSECIKPMFNEDSSNMFKNLKGLTALDLSAFYTGNVTDMSGMFYDCSNIEEIWVTKKWTAYRVVNSTDMFYNCIKLVGIGGTEYNPSYTDKTYARPDNAAVTPGYLSGEALFKTGKTVNMKMKGLFGQEETYLVTNTNIKAIKYSEDVNLENAVIVSLNGSTLPIYMWRDGGTLCWYSANRKPYLNSESTHMFTELAGIEELDISDFNTSRVTTIANMFYYCSKLKTIYVGDLWSTEHLSGVSADVFTGCAKIEGGNGTTYDASNVSSNYAKIDGEDDTPGYLTRKP